MICSGRTKTGRAADKPHFGKDRPRPSVRAKLNASKPLKWLPWDN